MQRSTYLVTAKDKLMCGSLLLITPATYPGVICHFFQSLPALRVMPPFRFHLASPPGCKPTLTPEGFYHCFTDWECVNVCQFKIVIMRSV